jgi:nitrogen fixation NifU-like protein
MFYSKEVMDHFSNPRNVGEIKEADGVGEIGNPVCGDMMTFYVKISDNRIEDVKFKTFGCGAAIAVSSMVSEMAFGKTLEEAMNITNASVAKALGGLPPNKMHCSNLGADALHKAIEHYKSKQGQQHVSKSQSCSCPLCETELKNKCTSPSFCKPCCSSGNKNVVICSVCKAEYLAEYSECPSCFAAKKNDV